MEGSQGPSPNPSNKVLGKVDNHNVPTSQGPSLNLIGTISAKPKNENGAKPHPRNTSALMLAEAPKEWTDISDDLTLEITISGPGRMGELQVHFEDDGYFTSKTVPLERGRATLVLEPGRNASRETLKEFLEIQAINNRGNKFNHTSLRLLWRWFTREFYEGNRVYNGVLFGPAGTTKSSFINSCYSMLSGTWQPEIALSGGGSVHVTKSFRSYRLGDIELGKPANIRLWDTVGLARDNEKSYLNFQFDRLLDGAPLDGFEYQRESKWEDSSKKKELEVHVVIFFLNAPELDSSNSSWIEKIKEFRQMATDRDMETMIVIAKVDLINPKIRGSADSNGNDNNAQNLENILEKARTIFDLSHDYVLPLINYYGESESNFQVDRSAFTVLQTAFQLCIRNVRRFG